ncbi:MAG: PIN domain-containing protein, partial [Promicromonosporaceae bacterium]|nr:PIN domain-containing protein [Promicromonosporaceae bacterium]
MMPTKPERLTYVLDTSVVLSDPKAFLRFDEHDVVLPVVVITELEAKRHHPELGYFARAALRLLDDLRLVHGRLDRPIPKGEHGGTLRVEINQIDQAVLPAGFRDGSNDAKILAVAANLAQNGLHVVVISKDLPLRIKASSVGLDAQEYRAEQAFETGWTGMTALYLSDEQMSALWSDNEIPLATLDEAVLVEAGPLAVNTGVIITSPRGSALGRVVGGERLRLVRGDQDVFGVHGRSAEQR